MVRPGAILIAGIADGLGIALSETFARAGHDVLGIARSSRVADSARQKVTATGRQYTHIEADLRCARKLEASLAVHSPQIDTAIYLAQRFERGGFLDMRSDDFADVLATNCVGAANVARCLLPDMAANRRGTLIFLGATASVRGGAAFSALAASKFALRGLAQSLAREFGPQGIHVVHLIIDALIDEPQTDLRFPARAETRIDPSSLANTCLMLSRQPPDAFTQELDLRHSAERF